MKFFDKITDIKELKKAYKQWAMKLHPDLGGSEDEFKAMSAEYDVCFKNIKLGIKNRTHSDNVTLDDDGYREVIDALLSLDGVRVELCGEWLWIHCDSKEFNDIFKRVGCRWARQKKLWYWKPAWMKGTGRHGGKDMDEIRAKYGSVDVRGYSRTYTPELA